MVSEMESQPPSRGPGDGERRLSGSNLCSSSWVSADGFLRRRPSVRDRLGRGKRHNEKPSQRNRKLSPKGGECTRKSCRWGAASQERGVEGGNAQRRLWDLERSSDLGLDRHLRKVPGPWRTCIAEP